MNELFEMNVLEIKMEVLNLIVDLRYEYEQQEFTNDVINKLINVFQSLDEIRINR